MSKNKEHKPTRQNDVELASIEIHPGESAFGTTESTSYCDQIIIAILLVIIIAVPLFFGGNLYSVFDLSKITKLYILTFTIVIVWCVKTIIS